MGRVVPLGGAVLFGLAKGVGIERGRDTASIVSHVFRTRGPVLTNDHIEPPPIRLVHLDRSAQRTIQITRRFADHCVRSFRIAGVELSSPPLRIEIESRFCNLLRITLAPSVQADNNRLELSVFVRRSVELVSNTLSDFGRDFTLSICRGRVFRLAAVSNGGLFACFAIDRTNLIVHLRQFGVPLG